MNVLILVFGMDKILLCGQYRLGMQQYGQKPYSELLFEILQYITILQYLALYWRKDRVYTGRKAHPMKCTA